MLHEAKETDYTKCELCGYNTSNRKMYKRHKEVRVISSFYFTAVVGTKLSVTNSFYILCRLVMWKMDSNVLIVPVP